MDLEQYKQSLDATCKKSLDYAYKELARTKEELRLMKMAAASLSISSDTQV